MPLGCCCVLDAQTIQQVLERASFLPTCGLKQVGPDPAALEGLLDGHGPSGNVGHLIAYTDWGSFHEDMCTASSFYLPYGSTWMLPRTQGLQDH